MAGSNHGHTPAAWTGVIIAFVGFCVASVFIVMAEPVGFWVGIGLTLLGAVVGGLMRRAGLGQAENVHPVHKVTENA
ncbi:HGxxPAAW family protein [Streptomyces abyssomicinicus]|uniref:HGxxPAAW family protein n=1 Tax=Streptomyces abyssomicinicus TaxID=574929 RepID=UPI0012509163|nr:HGxxPAAW family protein [Streptomyces abyssomicinicus]